MIFIVDLCLLTLLTAVLNVLPIFGPFLPPLKREIAALTDLGREPVLLSLIHI